MMNDDRDRRRVGRLDVVGLLVGTLQFSQGARVVDISEGGALIASPIRLPIGLARGIRLTIEGSEVTVAAVVRHVTRVVHATQAEYLVGFEFVSEPPDLSAFL